MSSSDLRNVRAVLPLFLQYGTVTPCRMAIQLIDSGCHSASVASRPSDTKTSSRGDTGNISSDWLTFLITGEKSRKFTSKLVLRQHHRFQVISGCRERSCLKKWQQEASAGVSWSLVTWSAEVHRCADWHVRKSRGKSWPHCAPLMLCGQPAAYTVQAHAC